MNNPICIFFGHKDNKKLDKIDDLKVVLYNKTLSNIRQCTRCQQCYFEAIT